MVAQGLEGLVTEGLELEVFELAAFDCSFDGVIVVDVLVFYAEEQILQADHNRVAFKTHVTQSALHSG